MRDLTLVIGGGLVVAGVWNIYWPAALILAGLALVAVARNMGDLGGSLGGEDKQK